MNATTDIRRDILNIAHSIVMTNHLREQEGNSSHQWNQYNTDDVLAAAKKLLDFVED